MKILYLGYWPSADGLTQSVIVPRLEIISRRDDVQEIFFCSVERDGAEKLMLKISKVTQVFFYSQPKSNVFFTKFNDIRELKRLTSDLVTQHKISFVICNSPLAGMIGYHLHKKNKIPFVVECFEPHALYMKESGSWKFWDPRYWVLRYFEERQKKTALILATVSQTYSNQLEREGVSKEKILSIPNCVPLDDFKFNPERRIAKRAALDIDEKDLVGIYVGKFGDIYYDEEAFDLFAEAFQFFGENFRMIILSSKDKRIIVEEFRRRSIPETKLHVALVARNEVADFLSASDFAFSTIRPAPCRIYCCPIKDGEYWANGLPILLEEGIGEDSAIVRDEGGGVLFDRQHAVLGFEKLSGLMKKGRATYASEIFLIALKYRSMEFLSSYYKRLFDRPGF